MTIRSMLIAAALAVSATTLAHAQPQDPAATPGTDKRQEMQQKRIEQGIQSGQLTPREAGRMERRQQHVQHMEDKAKADGTVTAKERARIHHAQDQDSRRIHREKHDRQHAK